MMVPDARGHSPIHRIPPEAKLLALFAYSIVMFALDSRVVLSWLAATILAVAVLCCRSAIAQWLKAWPLLLTIAALGMWTVLARGPEAALTTLLRLGSLSLFATIVTVSTTVGQFIVTITRLVVPLEKLGIANARDIGLAIGLVIRFVPEVHARYRNVVDAHRARGLMVRPSTIIVPMVIAIMLSANDIADAIDARNIRATSSARN